MTSRPNDPAQVRPREPADLRRCVDILDVVHRADGYPTRWPADPAAWLTPAGLLRCWVAEADGVVVGHAGLTRVGADGERLLLDATGRAADGLARVSRLFVHPDARGRGAARALLDTVAEEAGSRGLRPVLDVVTDGHDAIRLYDRAGWLRVGTGDAPWTNAAGQRPRVHFYIAP